MAVEQVVAMPTEHRADLVAVVECKARFTLISKILSVARVFQGKDGPEELPVEVVTHHLVLEEVAVLVDQAAQAMLTARVVLVGRVLPAQLPATQFIMQPVVLGEDQTELAL